MRRVSRPCPGAAHPGSASRPQRAPREPGPAGRPARRQPGCSAREGSAAPPGAPVDLLRWPRWRRARREPPAVLPGLPQDQRLWADLDRGGNVGRVPVASGPRSDRAPDLRAWQFGPSHTPGRRLPHHAEPAVRGRAPAAHVGEPEEHQSCAGPHPQQRVAGRPGRDRADPAGSAATRGADERQCGAAGPVLVRLVGSVLIRSRGCHDVVPVTESTRRSAAPNAAPSGSSAR